MKKGNTAALLPILVILVLYLGLGITFEYVMKIPMGFYNNPIMAARFAVAMIFVIACLVSTATGASVGTITLITPIAPASGCSAPEKNR